MQLDETDIAILRCVQSDARMSLRDIAKAIGVSTPTVSARLSSLERLGIVRGYAAIVDPERLNETIVTLVIKAKLPAADRVAKAVAELRWTRRVTIARGGRILAEATMIDPAGIDSLLDAIAKIPNVVDAEHYVGVRTVKEEPRAVLADRMKAKLTCFQCRGPISGEPIKRRIDGRSHFFCCRSCEGLYLKKYRTLKARV